MAWSGRFFCFIRKLYFGANQLLATSKSTSLLSSLDLVISVEWLVQAVIASSIVNANRIFFIVSLIIICFMSKTPFRQYLPFRPDTYLGQVFISQIWMSSLPHCKHRRPTSLLNDGASSAMIPPTTRFWMVWQCAHEKAVICCLNRPRPSYTSAS